MRRWRLDKAFSDVVRRYKKASMKRAAEWMEHIYPLLRPIDVLSYRDRLGPARRIEKECKRMQGRCYR